MEQLIKYKAIITKTKDLRNNSFASILEGQKFEAFFFEEPIVGKSFIFYDQYSSTPIHTTPVIEIIDDRSFITKNSIYSIYTIENQRNDKIENLLK